MKPSCFLSALLLLGYASFFASPENIRAAEPASGATVAAFRQFLTTLDSRNFTSISAARAEMEKQFSKAPDPTAVEAFQAFREFYSTAARTIDRTYFWGTAKETQRKDFQAALNEIMSDGSGNSTF